ncbi:MAG: caspase family protein [Cytophagales bacterium]|nr:caspase family protein [Cytophagales bacterium]
MMKKILLLISFFVFVYNACAQDKVLFKENFKDNQKKWLVTNTSNVKAKVINGKYIVQQVSTTGASLFLNANANFNSHKNFEITTTLKQLSGDQRYGYGFVWGAKDGNNFFAFTISSDGKCNIYQVEDGEFIQIRPWVRLGNEIIKPMGQLNTLKIKKKEKRILFYVNGEHIHTADFQPFLGKQMGYIVNANMKLSIQNVKVKRKMSQAEKDAKPVVVWFNPKHELSTIYTKHLHVEANIKSLYPIVGVRLMVNDEVYGNAIEGGGLQEVLAEDITLELGINELQLFVEDEQGNLTISKRIIKVDTKTGTLDRKDYALLFATNEYAHWTDLTNPVFDAKAIAKELTERYGFEVEIVENAPKRDMMAKLKEYAKKSYNPHDQLFVFFAGHGQYDEDFGEGYVVCSNSLVDDDGNTSYIPHSILRTIINNIPCEHTCLMMDVCFGGTFDQNLSKHRGGGNNISQNTSSEQFIARKLEFKTRKFITSGGKEYVPDGRAGNHSPFARRVLEALRNNGGKDYILTFSELIGYVEHATPTPHHGEFGENEPGSDFLFIAER